MKIKHSSSSINEKDYKYIKNVFDKNFVGEGDVVVSLEKKLATYTRRKYCKVVNNGSNALLLALLVLKKEFPNKNKVITSSYICPAVINSILQANLVPILVDINPSNLNINVNEIFRKINSKILTIIITHLAGIPVNFCEIENISIPIINDCAQAIGSKINNKPLGYYGDFCIYSFGSTKMITGGIGGAILTSNSKYFRIINELVSYEKASSYYIKYGFDMSYNMKISDVNSAIIINQLNKINDFIQRRRYIAQKYDECFCYNKKYLVQNENKDDYFNRYRYYVLADNGVEINNYLNSKGIESKSSISHNIAKYYKLNNFSNLNILSKKVISLPIYPEITKDILDYIINMLRNKI